MKKAKNSVPCSDWQLGWGYGGNDHIGTLSREGDIYVWTGRRQGRHGQKIASRYSVRFSVVDGNIEIDRSQSHRYFALPATGEVLKAIDELNS